MDGYFNKRDVKENEVYHDLPSHLVVVDPDDPDAVSDPENDEVERQLLVNGYVDILKLGDITIAEKFINKKMYMKLLVEKNRNSRPNEDVCLNEGLSGGPTDERSRFVRLLESYVFSLQSCDASKQPAFTFDSDSSLNSIVSPHDVAEIEAYRTTTPEPSQSATVKTLYSDDTLSTAHDSPVKDHVSRETHNNDNGINILSTKSLENSAGVETIAEKASDVNDGYTRAADEGTEERAQLEGTENKAYIDATNVRREEKSEGNTTNRTTGDRTLVPNKGEMLNEKATMETVEKADDGVKDSLGESTEVKLSHEGQTTGYDSSPSLLSAPLTDSDGALSSVVAHNHDIASSAGVHDSASTPPLELRTSSSTPTTEMEQKVEVSLNSDTISSPLFNDGSAVFPSSVTSTAGSTPTLLDRVVAAPSIASTTADEDKALSDSSLSHPSPLPDSFATVTPHHHSSTDQPPAAPITPAAATAGLNTILNRHYKPKLKVDDDTNDELTSHGTPKGMLYCGLSAR